MQLDAITSYGLKVAVLLGALPRIDMPRVFVELQAGGFIDAGGAPTDAGRAALHARHEAQFDDALRRNILVNLSPVALSGLGRLIAGAALSEAEYSELRRFESVADVNLRTGELEITKTGRRVYRIWQENPEGCLRGPPLVASSVTGEVP